MILGFTGFWFYLWCTNILICQNQDVQDFRIYRMLFESIMFWFLIVHFYLCLSAFICVRLFLILLLDYHYLFNHWFIWISKMIDSLLILGTLRFFQSLVLHLQQLNVQSDHNLPLNGSVLHQLDNGEI